MDYILELAQNPDIHEAITLAAADPNETPVRTSARALKEYDFLRDEHRTIWTMQVVNAFYGEPELAAEAWRLLRYCLTSRLALAGQEIDTAGEGGEAAVVAKADALRVTHDTDQARRHDQADARMAEVDGRCSSEVPVEPPFFLKTVLEASGVDERDVAAQVPRLLKDPALVRELARGYGIAVPFNIVLDAELAQIDATRRSVSRAPSRHAGPAAAPGPPRQAALRSALDANLFGVAFSGGGIRSATFNLGILQALSKVGLLRQVDYLSTVSGGGYIGGWLAAWIRRESVAVGRAPDGLATMLDMQRRLSPSRSPNPMDDRVRPIRFLREYSNYLTPRNGFFSADTWTMVGIYLRNTLLNQIILVACLAVVLLVPRLWMAIAQRLPPVAWLEPMTWIVAALWVVGSLSLLSHLRTLRPIGFTMAKAGEKGAKRKRLFSRLARPLTIHVTVLLPWVATVALVAASFARHDSWAEHRTALALVSGALVAATLLAVLGAGGAHRCWTARAKRTSARNRWRNRAQFYVTHVVVPNAAKVGLDAAAKSFMQHAGVASAAWTEPGRLRRGWVKTEAALVMTLSAVVAGVVAAGLTWVLLRVLAAMSDDGMERMGHGVALGTAGLLSALSLSIVSMLGMLGERLPDEYREWWSRFRTCLHLWSMAWLALFVAALYLPWLLQWLHLTAQARWPGWAAFFGWVASTLFGVWRGQTAEDDVKQEHEAEPEDVPLTTSTMRLAAAVAPYVFIVGLVVAIAVAIDRLYVANLPDPVAWLRHPNSYWSFVHWTATTAATPIAFAAVLLVGALFSWRVDINDFSLHHFYKNRLVRSYLGASHGTDRHPDWFTGFDPRDDVRLEQFDHDRTGKGRKYPHHAPYAGPYPILNCALNLVGGEDLAWQERKSASFVFTPKYCGYDVDRAVLTQTRNGLRQDAYVPTSSYYHQAEGPLLGMAMSISGAAANPNMGRASSPALAFLMTVFNVRLGWWLRNPRRKDGVGRPSPVFGLPYTALELFGGTDDRKKFVNVSDGGHFENLGVYELIRRGCRYIVVCDAGQDERFTCEDLGNLVRLCRTDFGVEIDIDIDRVRAISQSRLTDTHCVVGKIHYLSLPRRAPAGRLLNEEGGPLLRGTRPAHEEGYLLYIKTSLTGDEPQDVLEYSRRVPRFPHQSTADQWFDESQFESYRTLGMHVGETTFGRYQDDDSKPLADVDELFRRLNSYWHAPAAVINERSTELVSEYTRILERIHADPKLEGLDRALFDGAPAAKKVDPRDEIFVCNSMIQLMENVYAELELERLWRHPHLQGWMTVFERWAQRPEFRRTWRIVEPTYAERFRNFYNDRLKGRTLALPRLFVAGHRGVPTAGSLLENTIDAFETAIARGANVLELDVRRLQCGTLVVWHDTHAGGTAVSSMTLSDLQKLEPRATTLEAFAAHFHGRVQLAIELKVAGLEADVCRVLTRTAGRAWRRRDFVLMSFDTNVLDAIGGLDPSIRTGWLVHDPAVLDAALERTASKHPRFVDVRADFLGPDETLLDADRLAEAAAKRVPLVPWTVNAPGRLATLLCHEAIAGVITDDPAAALAAKRGL